MRGRLRPFLSGEPFSDTLELQVRDLVTHPAFVPIISRDSVPGPRVRPPRRVSAIYADGRWTALHREETVVLLGFVVGRRGGEVFGKVRPFETDLSEGFRHAGLDTRMPAGALPKPLLLQGTRHTATEVPALMRQARAWVSWGVGAGGANALHAVSAARAGDGRPALVARLAREHFTKGDSLADAVVAPPLSEAKMWIPSRSRLERDQLTYLLHKLELVPTEGVAAETAALFDLHRVGASDAYLFALLEGRESQAVETFLTQASLAKAAQRRDMRDAVAAAAATAQAQQYLLIVEDKLGPKRLDDLVASFATRKGRKALALADLQSDPAKVLAMLAKHERVLVQTEYANRERQTKAKVANKCGHVAAVRRLHSAVDLKDKDRALAALTKYLKRPDGKSGWLECRECGFPAMCAHVRDLAELEIKRAPFTAVRARMQHYAGRDGVNRSTDTTAYFCATCCAQVAEVLTGEPNGPADDANPAIRTRVWSEALKLAPLVRHPVPTDPQRFAAAAADVVCPLVAKMDDRAAAKRKLARNARSSHEDGEIDPTTHLHIVLLVYAYVLRLVQATQNKTDRIGFQDVPAHSKIGKYAAVMFDRLLTTRNSLFRELENVTPEYLRARFADAYQLALNEHLVVRTPNPEEELANLLLNNQATFAFALDAAARSHALPRRKPGPDAAKKTFETVMGQSLPTLSKVLADAAASQPKTRRQMPVATVNMYAHMFRPKVDPKGADALWAFVANPSPELAEKASWAGHKGLYQEAYDQFAEYVITGAADASRRQRLFDAERVIDEALAPRRCRALWRVSDTHAGRYVRRPMSITKLYDERGAPHEWQTFVYVDSSGKPLEVSVRSNGRAVVHARLSGELTPDHTLVDMRCDTCGVLQSETDKLDADKTTQSLAALTKIDTFFAFYRDRCPAGGTHAWSALQCGKCGLHETLLVGSALIAARGLRTQARTYYETYAKEFAAAMSLLATSPLPPALEPREPPKVTPYPYDYSVVTRAADAVGVPVAAIEAIGAYERRLATAVLEGAPADLPSSPNDPRLLHSRAVVRVFVAKYNALRYVGRSLASVPTGELAALLDEAGVPAGEYAALSTLPDAAQLAPDVDPATLSPADQQRHSVERLCRLVVSLSALEHKNAHLTKVADLFARQTLRGLLRNERLMCTPKVYKVAHTVDDTDGVELDSEEAADDEPAENPFSYENMDYDGIND
jgi:rubrerythrin